MSQDLVDQIVALVMRVQRLEGRVSGKTRHGSVAEVDTEKQRVRIKVGGTDEEPFLSPWVPYAQVAGPGTGLKIHAPPTVGQNMTIMAPGGDMRQSVAIPQTWSDSAPSPGTGADPVGTYGNFKFEITTSSAKVSMGEANSIEITAEKITLTVGGASIELKADELKNTVDKMKVIGSSLKHNAKEIGDTHKHTEVVKGGDLTGVPE